MPLPFPTNPALQAVPVYQPGRPIEEVARELGLTADGIIKLASNENPLGPSPKALAAMRETLDRAHFYPDGGGWALRNAIAGKLGLARENVILGNGSNEIIEFVGHALLAPGADIVVSQYCFAIYPIVAKLFGAKEIFVTAGSPEKCQACVKLGATRAIDYKTEDFVEVVKTATQNRGVDLILHGHVELENQRVGKPLKITQIGRFARRDHGAVALGEQMPRELAAEARRATGDEPDGFFAAPGIVVCHALFSLWVIVKSRVLSAFSRQ